MKSFKKIPVINFEMFVNSMNSETSKNEEDDVIWKRWIANSDHFYMGGSLKRRLRLFLMDYINE